MTAASAHLRNCTLVSILVSMAFSAAFFILIFGQKQVLTVWNPDQLALDFVPQTLATAFMAALVPGLQTRAKVAAGGFPGHSDTKLSIFRRAAVLAILSLALAGFGIGLLWLAGITTLSSPSALAMKIAFGGLLGLIVTPVAVRALLIGK